MKMGSRCLRRMLLAVVSATSPRRAESSFSFLHGRGRCRTHRGRDGQHLLPVGAGTDRTRPRVHGSRSPNIQRSAVMVVLPYHRKKTGAAVMCARSGTPGILSPTRCDGRGQPHPVGELYVYKPVVGFGGEGISFERGSVLSNNIGDLRSGQLGHPGVHRTRFSMEEGRPTCVRYRWYIWPTTA